MHWWIRYWFADGGRYGIAVIRIAVAIAAWWSLDVIAATWSGVAFGAPEASTVYRPVGVWMVAGGAAPPAFAVDLLWVVARIATLAMLVGCASRIVTAVSCIAVLALASLYESGQATWSHSLNVVCLAQLALLGARTGDVLSIDALIRRWRRLPPVDVPRGYQWSIRLVQLAVALMFASGMFHKVVQGGLPTLDWALSDNLRHQLIVRYDLTGSERPGLVDWLLADALRYKAAALLNLVSQLMPLVACFLVRRPVLRALCGAFFVVETMALGLVMELWNLHWLPLAAVFVDWDALLRRPSVTERTTSPRQPRIAAVFIACFVVLGSLAAFVPRLDRRLNAYPFTSFPMFASIRARKPYDVHQPYSVAHGRFELIASAPVHELLTRSVNHVYRKTFAVRTREQLRTRLAAILADARAEQPSITAVRYWYTTFEVPAYPGPPEFAHRDVAIIGELATDGSFHSQLGADDVRTTEIVDGDARLRVVVEPDGTRWLVSR